MRVGACQVFYRTSGQGGLQVLSTNRTSAELQLPVQEGYVVHVRATTAGGDGASSAPVRIPRRTSKRPGHTLSPTTLAGTPSPRGPSVHSFPTLCPSGPETVWGVRGEAGGTSSSGVVQNKGKDETGRQKRRGEMCSQTIDLDSASPRTPRLALMKPSIDLSCVCHRAESFSKLSCFLRSSSH